MSAMRISVPGQPTILRDEGPGVGRITRGVIYGGILVAPSLPSKAKPARVMTDEQEALMRARHFRYYTAHKAEIMERQRQRRARK